MLYHLVFNSKLTSKQLHVRLKLRVGTVAAACACAGSCAWAQLQPCALAQGVARGHSCSRVRLHKVSRVGTICTVACAFACQRGRAWAELQFPQAHALSHWFWCGNSLGVGHLGHGIDLTCVRTCAAFCRGSIIDSPCPHMY